MDAKISIIMPSLNVKEYIDQALSSVCEQTLKEIEIISVDAGSDDGTREIIQKWAEKDQRIAIIDSEKKSYGYQVNLGMEMSCGEYIAILETDDFVESNMYEYLYNVAAPYKLDYIKSDYYAYWTMNNGKKLSFKRDIFSANGFYDKIICPVNYYETAVYDHYLWNGIYKRSFLQENNIKFNETPGASYQDIGFIFQTIIRANSVKYITEPFYHYCLDRMDSSTNTDKSLVNFWQEFFRLYQAYENFSEIEKSFFYVSMARIFPFCCKIPNDDAEKNNSDIKEKYEWFRHNLQYAIDKNFLQSNMLDKNLWIELNKLLNKSWQEIIQNDQSDDIKSILNAENVVIFGCGYRGFCAYKYLKNNSKKPYAFLDNNSQLWHENIDDIPIKSPKDYLYFPKNTIYVIANDSHYIEIKEQLLLLGVEKDKIYRFE